jgi:hypothetical protein
LNPLNEDVAAGEIGNDVVIITLVAADCLNTVRVPVLPGCVPDNAVMHSGSLVDFHSVVTHPLDKAMVNKQVIELRA